MKEEEKKKGKGDRKRGLRNERVKEIKKVYGRNSRVIQELEIRGREGKYIREVWVVLVG